MTDASQRLTAPSVLGILLGLAVVGGTVWQLLDRRSEQLGAEAGQSALEERFELSEPFAFGFTVREARRLPKDELYVTLAAGEDIEEPEPLAFEGRIAKKKEKQSGGRPGRGGAGHGASREDGTEWGKVQLGEVGTPPVEAAFLFVEGKEKGDVLLGGQFGVHFKDLSGLGSEGEAVPIESGYEAWGPYDANWIHLRHYQLVDGVPTSHDTVRVNLTTTSEARVVYLRWPRTHPADPEQVWLFLEGFRARES